MVECCDFMTQTNNIKDRLEAMVTAERPRCDNLHGSGYTAFLCPCDSAVRRKKGRLKFLPSRRKWVQGGKGTCSQSPSLSRGRGWDSESELKCLEMVALLRF